MLEFHSKKIKNNDEEIIIKKHFNLDKDVDCFIIISSDDNKFGDALSHKILDSIIDRIDADNIYDDFSAFLETINSFIKAWHIDSKHEAKNNVMISLLHKKDFLFSTIGHSSCYLINSQKEVIEVTDHKDTKKYFNYVSQWNIESNDIIICSNLRLLQYLSKSDFIDSLKVSNIDSFVSNLKDILSQEENSNNICITALQKKDLIQNKVNSFTQHKYFQIAQDYGLKALDNNITKKIVGLAMLSKDKLLKQSHLIKNISIVIAILLCFLVLYSIISSLLSSTTQSSQKDDAKLQLQQAIEYTSIANKNLANPAIFQENISLAEDIISNIADENLYINDVNKISGDISILKKQYNGVETFEATAENEMYSNLPGFSGNNIINNDGKLFIIHDKSITGPIIAGQEAKNNVFDKLEADEVFIDATLLGNDIILLTNFSKVVSFTKNAYFSFQDVKDQVTWDKASSIYSFGNNNIYFISEDGKQVKRHRKNTTWFNAGQEYLSEEDAKALGWIQAIGIDGGIYILKDDMSMVKLFVSPEYRLQSMILNKLPKNYEFSEGKIDIKTAANLNYVYMLLDNKIWIFQPDSRRYQDTKSLTYIGQVEGKNHDIQDFYVNNDKEIFIINSQGL